VVGWQGPEGGEVSRGGPHGEEEPVGRAFIEHPHGDLLADRQPVLHAGYEIVADLTLVQQAPAGRSTGGRLRKATGRRLDLDEGAEVHDLLHDARKPVVRCKAPEGGKVCWGIWGSHG